MINPVYDNMFSALRHYPPSTYNFRPHRISDSLGHDRRVYHAPAQVDGSDRYKFFRRPIIPYMPTLGGQVVYARKPAPVVATIVERPVTPPTKTVAVQTIYRESEAQTDPYSPEYVLPAGQQPPELLALATLTWGAGLPAGMAELEMIERARAKRAWEAMLPHVVDQETFEKRLKMMEEMELREWQDREEEIRRLQEARLQILSKVIQKREEENEIVNNERVEKIWHRKLQEREAMLEKINKKRVKAMRKLTEKRNKVENKIERRDIISEYVNYGSKVYAPRARDGVFKDKASTSLPPKTIKLDSYQGLLDLESTFSHSVLNADISLPNRNERLKNPVARKELHMQEQLRLMDIKLKERKAAVLADEKPLKFAQRIEKPPQRPPTPKVKEPLPEEEEMEMAALTLQKLIRGRISQNLMYQGKERRLQLINELRTRQTIKKATEIHLEGKLLKPSDENEVDELVKSRVGTSKTRSGSRKMSAKSAGGEGVEYEEDGDSEVEFVEGEEYKPPTQDFASPEWLEKVFESNVQAEYVGKTLDFLSKELVRLREERRIAAMVRLAERTRKMREAEETDRRETELKRRQQEDEVFRHVMRVHQETVDSYLEDIIASSIDHTSSLQAKQQVREYANIINGVVDELEKRNAEQPERTVADLVMSFLIPEVEKEQLRQQVKQDQRKYLMAAHRAVYAEIPAVEDKIAQEKAAAEKAEQEAAEALEESEEAEEEEEEEEVDDEEEPVEYDE
ncbi:Cilia- and flagella-associated protein 91 [Chytridiales sp. JEL 0842]|nr:Cilia- and flagella-associated protein 91 [Chytridiales sp. JEL 0842]